MALSQKCVLRVPKLDENGYSWLLLKRIDLMYNFITASPKGENQPKASGP